MNQLLTKLLLWILMPAPLVSPSTVRSARIPDCSLLHTSRGTVSLVETEDAHPLQDATGQQQTYRLYNGDTVIFSRHTANSSISGPLTVHEYRVDSPEGTLCWYDADAGDWVVEPLAPGEIDASCIHVTAASGDFYCYTPKAYADLGSGSLRYLPALDGSLQILADAGGFWLRLTVPALPTGCMADATVVLSSQPLFDWVVPSLEDYWKAYSM